VQITHLGGNNLCTLDGNIIRLSDVSGVIRVNISSFGSSSAGAMSVKFQMGTNTLKQLNLGRSSNSRLFTESVALLAESQNFSVQYTFLSRDDSTFDDNLLIHFELIKL